MELILALILLVVIFSIGFLVGAKQEQKRQQPKEYIVPDEVREQLQKLAGIIEHDRSEGSKMLAEIMDNIAKKKDAAAGMFNGVLTELPELRKKLNLDKAKKTLDKSIEESKRFNEYRKNNPIPKKVKESMVNAPKLRQITEEEAALIMNANAYIPDELLKQNRKDIEDNEAASILLTGETDAHYYYKQKKDTKIK